ncbi:hypothetical protein [Flavobacteriaceae bacterium 14752]|uniref:hypothetical protein n=1 Tax=Mesohalobacter salilacus TaxID=2491711 RepID=UPI000F63087C|nr:hypothetical protein EIG84_09295 [Flavobacteriaceae bacterium 14752]
MKKVMLFLMLAVFTLSMSSFTNVNEISVGDPLSCNREARDAVIQIAHMEEGVHPSDSDFEQGWIELHHELYLDCLNN